MSYWICFTLFGSALPILFTFVTMNSDQALRVSMGSGQKDRSSVVSALKSLHLLKLSGRQQYFTLHSLLPGNLQELSEGSPLTPV